MSPEFKEELAARDEKYTATILNIRLRNFSNNLPFLILSDKLPEGQVYREFSDGRIEIQEVFAVGAEFKSKKIKTLTTQQATLVRKENGLL